QGQRVPVSNPGRIPLYTLRTKGVHETQADIDALAVTGKKQAAVMVWNYHDDDVEATPATIQLEVTSIPAQKVQVTHYRIDKDNSNSYEVWKKMGSPASPTPEQYKQLEAAGGLQQLGAPQWHAITGGRLPLSFSLPRQGVSLLRLSW
ncbi:MAG TPA: hypothetical protein VLD19_12425, partial [Chitinophagaceae bacterium]|nr:hypothetical protein [Chitinophagaceae bacterium]